MYTRHRHGTALPRSAPGLSGGPARLATVGLRKIRSGRCLEDTNGALEFGDAGVYLTPECVRGAHRLLVAADTAVHLGQVEIDPVKNLAARGDEQQGHEKFGLYCAACHGPEGQGYVVGGAGPAIGLSGFLDAASDDYIFQTLKQGRINTAMRPFIGARGLANLNEQDAFDIIAYMRSLGASGK